MKEKHIIKFDKKEKIFFFWKKHYKYDFFIDNKLYSFISDKNIKIKNKSVNDDIFFNNVTKNIIVTNNWNIITDIDCINHLGDKYIEWEWSKLIPVTVLSKLWDNNYYMPYNTLINEKLEEVHLELNHRDWMLTNMYIHHIPYTIKENWIQYWYVFAKQYKKFFPQELKNGNKFINDILGNNIIYYFPNGVYMDDDDRNNNYEYIIDSKCNIIKIQSPENNSLKEKFRPYIGRRIDWKWIII